MIRRAGFAALLLLALAVPLSAARLPRTVLPVHYRITFVPDLEHETFRGEEAISVEVKQPVRSVTLNAVDLEITSATKGGMKAGVTYDKGAETATLTFPKPIPRGRAVISIAFSGELSKKLRGLYLSRTARRKYAATQFESTYARRAFPSFDEPNMKAVFEISVVVDKGDTAISNGKIVADTPGPGKGKHTIRFGASPKMSSYLVMLAVGDFECVSGAADGTPIRVCAIPEKKSLTRFALAAAENELPFFNRYYGVKYPFGKLDLIALPDFEAGAMENVGAITFRETALLLDEKTAPLGSMKGVASTIAHEIAHMWFGDLVTLDWWDDLWLNEGFASWAGPKAVQAWKPGWTTATDMAAATSGALGADALASTRAIRVHAESPAEIETLFDGIAYGKAAAMLRMVEAYTGAEAFRKGVEAYLKKHSFANATAEDFWNTMAASTRQPVDRIFRSYVEQPGSPIVSAEAVCKDEKTLLTLRQRRAYGDRAHFLEPSDQTWVVPVNVRDLDHPKTEPLRFVIDKREQTFTIAGCKPHLYINAGGVGLYRSQHAAGMLDVPLLSALSPAEQVALLNDSWTLVRLGVSDVGQQLNYVDKLRASRNRTVYGLFYGYLEYADTFLTTPANRAQFREWAAGLARPVIAELGWTPRPGESEETGELRRSALDILGGVARDPETLERARAMVRDLLAGKSEIDPSLAGTLVRLAAQRGDAALYDAYWARAKTASNPTEFSRYLYTLSGFEDPALIRRTLDLALSPEVRSQDAPRLIYGATFVNRDAARLVWEYMKSHWGEIEKKFSGPTVAGMVGVAGVLCEKGAREEVSSFFAAHPVPGSERGLRQALERIDACVELTSLQTPNLQRWIESRAASAPSQ
jgi:aminopeptidase N